MYVFKVSLSVDFGDPWFSQDMNNTDISIQCYVIFLQTRPPIKYLKSI